MTIFCAKQYISIETAVKILALGFEATSGNVIHKMPNVCTGDSPL